MRNLIKIFTFVFVSTILSMQATAQTTGFNYNMPLKGKKGIVKKLNEDLTVIVLEENENKRYVANNLPFEYIKEGLRVKFNAMESAIPPYIRMIGSPIQLTCIKVSTADKKKFDLTKKHYAFKKK